MKSKLIGLVLFISVLSCVYLFESAGSTGLFRILHWPAIFLTLVGPLGLLLISSSTDAIKYTFQMLKNSKISKLENILIEERALLQSLSSDFYQRGTRVFDNDHLKSISPSTARVIERLAIKIPINDVITLLEKERALAESKWDQALSIISLGVRLCPSIGMLGTILGMTQLLSHMNDTNQLGSNMSLALLTTFYGLFFSLILWTPLQHQVQQIIDLKSKTIDQASHWLQLLEQRKPGQYLNETHSQDHKLSIGNV